MGASAQLAARGATSGTWPRKDARRAPLNSNGTSDTSRSLTLARPQTSSPVCLGRLAPRRKRPENQVRRRLRLQIDSIGRRRNRSKRSNLAPQEEARSRRAQETSRFVANKQRSASALRFAGWFARNKTCRSLVVCFATQRFAAKPLFFYAIGTCRVGRFSWQHAKHFKSAGAPPHHHNSISLRLRRRSKAAWNHYSSLEPPPAQKQRRRQLIAARTCRARLSASRARTKVSSRRGGGISMRPILLGPAAAAAAERFIIVRRKARRILRSSRAQNTQGAQCRAASRVRTQMRRRFASASAESRLFAAFGRHARNLIGRTDSRSLLVVQRKRAAETHTHFRVAIVRKLAPPLAPNSRTRRRR